MQSPVNKKESRTFFGHPYLIGSLFFTEMWERFSFYYGIRPLLILFMTAGHHLWRWPGTNAYKRLGDRRHLRWQPDTCCQVAGGNWLGQQKSRVVRLRF